MSISPLADTARALEIIPVYKGQSNWFEEVQKRQKFIMDIKAMESFASNAKNQIEALVEQHLDDWKEIKRLKKELQNAGISITVVVPQVENWECPSMVCPVTKRGDDIICGYQRGSDYDLDKNGVPKKRGPHERYNFA